MNQDYIKPDNWSIIEEGFDVERVKSSESLFGQPLEIPDYVKRHKSVVARRLRDWQDSSQSRPEDRD